MEAAVNHSHRPPSTFLTKKIDFCRDELIAKCQEWGLDAKTTNTFLRCARNGAVFTHHVNGEFEGVTALEYIATDILYLHMLPKTYGREFLEPIKAWAIDAGVRTIQVTSNRLNGSNFKYFEKTLGFHRAQVVYSLDLWQTPK